MKLYRACINGPLLLRDFKIKTIGYTNKATEYLSSFLGKVKIQVSILQSNIALVRVAKAEGMRMNRPYQFEYRVHLFRARETHPCA